jgi:hypothetical protein
VSAEVEEDVRDLDVRSGGDDGFEVAFLCLLFFIFSLGFCLYFCFCFVDPEMPVWLALIRFMLLS